MKAPVATVPWHPCCEYADHLPGWLLHLMFDVLHAMYDAEQAGGMLTFAEEIAAAVKADEPPVGIALRLACDFGLVAFTPAASA